VKAPHRDCFLVLFFKPPGEMKLGKVWIHLGRMRRDPDQRRGQANAVSHAFDVGEAEVREMRLVAKALQFEVDGQAAEDVKAAAHTSDEQVLALGELIETGMFSSIRSHLHDD